MTGRAKGSPVKMQIEETPRFSYHIISYHTLFYYNFNNNVLFKIVIQIEEIGMRDGMLTGLENFQLKLLIEKLKCGIEKAENYHNKADKAMETLQSELSSYLKKECFLAAVSTACMTATAGGAAYGKQCYVHALLLYFN